MPYGRKTVWLLTENPHKFDEARSILAPFDISVRRLRGPKVEIQNLHLEPIARYAVDQAVGDHAGLVVAEDSGLFIDALGGFPGPYSSYVYLTIGLQGVLRLLGSKREASFQCAIAVGSRRMRSRVFTGIVRGQISSRVSGRRGFGYDPIFIPENSTKTFADLSKKFKNKHSHRAVAFRKLAEWFLQYPGQ